MAYLGNSKPITYSAAISIQGIAEQVTESYRFFMMLNGEIEVVRRNTRHFLTRQDILLICPDEKYQLSANGNNLVLVIDMRADFFLQGQSEQLGQYLCDSLNDAERDYAPIRQFLSQMALLRFEKNDINNLRLNELSYALLFYLNRYHYIPLPDDHLKNGVHTERRTKIVNYIEQNYQHSITLDDLSREMHLSSTYLSKYIRHSLGVNFYSYLNSIRLRHAVSDLRTTKQSVTNIALNNGFSCTASFIKLYKETYGTTPGRNRTEPPQNEDKSNGSIVPMDSDTLQESLKSFESFDYFTGKGVQSSISYPNSNVITVRDVTKYKSITPLWCTMINIGFSKNVTDSELRMQLTMAQKEIGFQYCRLQGMLSSDILPRISKGSEFNFSEFDRFIEFIISLGLIPFLDLTYRKHHLLFSPKDYVYTTAEMDSDPVSEEQFLSDISNLMRHCINTFGDDIVETWGFEICYKHDEILNLLETPLAFSGRFTKACEIIHKYSPRATVGGVGHNTSMPADIFSRVLDALDRHKCTPDFISLTIYPYEQENSKMDSPLVVSTDPHFASKRIDHLKSILKSHDRLTNKLFVTSFGADVFARNYTNDTCHQAAFITKNTIDLLGKADVLGYWQLSDIETRYSDASRILFGGNGLVNINGIPKPGFTALELLSKLSSQIVEKGDGYLLVTNTRNVLHLVLYNYAHFDDIYCVSAGSRVTLDDAYSVFRSPETKDFSVSLSGLEYGKYKVLSTTLSREHGSLLDAWVKYGILDNLQPTELQYFRDTVHPHRFARYMQCQDGCLNLNVQLLPHEVRFFTIIREL